jgi:hypothetical protein
MKFGFENEYFLRHKDGEILSKVPSYSLPCDAHGTLVEVRSEPFENPFQVLASFNAKYAQLVEDVARYDCTLACLNEHVINTYRQHEIAGFHIHFSKEEWHGLVLQKGISANDPPKDILPFVETLDKRFLAYYQGIKRHPHFWRAKAHGWEWRRLPATVDPIIVATVLAEEFWTPLSKAA